MAETDRIRDDAPDVKAVIRGKYDAIAPRYDWVLGLPEWLGLGRLRHQLLGQARGRVLEVAVGTGRNLPHYPRDCELTAVDFSAEMLQQAQRRAQRLARPTEFRLMDAEALAFPDASFDTVVCTLAACTFPHPVAAFREMGRVVQPEGRVLVLEHGFSDRPWLRRWQERRAERQFQWLGSRWDREPHRIAQQGGLEVLELRRTLFGVLHWMVLRRGEG